MSGFPLILIPIPKGRKGPVLKNWQTLSPEALAEFIAQNPECNRGIRHDNTAVLDPDSKEAGELCGTWEAEGKLPKTVTWITAAGNIKRLYKRPAGIDGALTIKELKLQLRTGTGLQDVIPDSYVNDPDKGIDGYYRWEEGHDPGSIEVADLPQEIIDYFKKHSGNGNGHSCKVALSKDLEPEDTGATGNYQAYGQKALANELATLAGAAVGDRNDRLNKSAFALGQLIAAGVLDRGTVEATLAGVAASIKLTGAEIRATIRSGIEDGMKQPRELPEKKARATQGRGKDSKRSNSVLRRFLRQLDIQATYALETGLKLLTDPPQVDERGFTPCSVLYVPDNPSHTAFLNIGQGEKRGFYVELEGGKTDPWIAGNLCKTISDKGSGPYMTPKDVYAYLSKTAGAPGGVGATGSINAGKKISDLRNAPTTASSNEQTKANEFFNECGHIYTISGNCHCLVKNLADGVRYYSLANFVAQITDEVTRDDGLKVTKEFTVSGNLAGLQLPPAKVPTKDFDGMKWVRERWGAAASTTPDRNNAVHLPNAILANSRAQGIERRTVYTHTGWRKINDVWRYLDGGGAIGPGEPVAVDLGENLHPYRLPKRGGIEAAQASQRFLGIGPWEIMAPLWSIVHLAPFADLLKIDFSLWLYGPTGSLKSTLLALAMNYFGHFTRLNLPGSWFSTVNSLERLTFILKDTICPIDDYCPPANQKESHAMAERAGRIIYQAGNRSARGRLGPDLMARPNYYPRSLIISTGETLLPGQRGSATARYLGIELDQKKNPIDKARLTEAQGEAHLYSAAMAAYLESLAPRLDDAQDEIRDLWTGYRTAFQNSSHHSRIPEAQAWLAVGFELGLRFNTSMGAITPDQSYDLLNCAWRVFQALGEKHSRIIQGDRPTLKFMNVLQELFIQGRIYVESSTASGPPPQNQRLLGWHGTEPEKNAELVGWGDESTIYLLPETTVRIVKEAVRRQGDFLSLGHNELLAALVREKISEPAANGRTTQPKWIQGSTKRVICVPLEKLHNDEVTEE